MERGRVAEVHAQEPHGRGHAREKHRLHVYAQALDKRLVFLRAATHRAEHRDEDVNTVGHRKRHDHGGGRRRRRGELDAQPSCDPHRRHHRRADYQDGRERARYRTQSDEHHDDDAQVHQWNERLHVPYRGFLERVVQHRVARQVRVDVGIPLLDLGGQLTRVRDRA